MSLRDLCALRFGCWPKAAFLVSGEDKGGGFATLIDCKYSTEPCCSAAGCARRLARVFQPAFVRVLSTAVERRGRPRTVVASFHASHTKPCYSGSRGEDKTPRRAGLQLKRSRAKSGAKSIEFLHRWCLRGLSGPSGSLLQSLQERQARPHPCTAKTLCAPQAVWE